MAASPLPRLLTQVLLLLHSWGPLWDQDWSVGHTEEEPERQRGHDYNCRNVIIYGMCPLEKEAEFTQCWGRKGGGMGGPQFCIKNCRQALAWCYHSVSLGKWLTFWHLLFLCLLPGITYEYNSNRDKGLNVTVHRLGILVTVRAFNLEFPESTRVGTAGSALGANQPTSQWQVQWWDRTVVTSSEQEQVLHESCEWTQSSHWESFCGRLGAWYIMEGIWPSAF